MERKKGIGGRARALTVLSALLLGAAAAWDGLNLARLQLSPRISYLLVAVAVALSLAAVLLRVFSRQTARTRNTIELIAIGLVLLAWWLRGDALIPADPPLAAIELLGAVVLAVSGLWSRRRVAGMQDDQREQDPAGSIHG